MNGQVSRTISRLVGAWWESLVAIDPMWKRFSPALPCAPTAIRSARFCSATSMMVCAGSPSRAYFSTAKPASVSRRSIRVLDGPRHLDP